MRSFWISLFVFVLLMCSCRSKKAVTEVNAIAELNAGVRYARYAALSDTSRMLRIGIDKSKLRITENIIIREYDKDTGIVTKETETKTELAQDFDKVVTEEEVERKEIVNNDSLNHFREVTKKVESEAESVTESNGLASVWERFGEIIGVATLAVIAYICWKLKSRVR